MSYLFIKEYPPKNLLGSGVSTLYTCFCFICTINSERKHFPIFTHLSEPGSISAGFQWTGSTPAEFLEASRVARLLLAYVNLHCVWHISFIDFIVSFILMGPVRIHVAVCCSVLLQCVAVCCCSVLQCVAVYCCSALQCVVAVCCSVLQCVVAVCCTNVSCVSMNVAFHDTFFFVACLSPQIFLYQICGHSKYTDTHIQTCKNTTVHALMFSGWCNHMGCLRLVGSLKL